MLTHHKWGSLVRAGGLCLTRVPGDVQLLPPRYHNTASTSLADPLMHGGTFALRRKFSASNFWNDCVIQRRSSSHR